MNTPLLQQHKYQKSAVMMVGVKEAEMDQMWSFVGSKRHQRWLWHSIEHRSCKVLAYVLGGKFYTEAPYRWQSKHTTD